MTPKNDLLELLNTNDIVAIDTCAILNEGFVKLFKESAKDISQLNKPIILHNSVLNELIRMSRTSTHPQHSNANKVLRILSAFEYANIFKCFGNPQDFRIADQQFLEYVIDLRTDKSIAIITLDKKLTSDILMQNKIDSYEGYIIKVYSLSPSGKLFDCSNLYNNSSVFNKSNNTVSYVNSIETYRKLFNL